MPVLLRGAALERWARSRGAADRDNGAVRQAPIGSWYLTLCLQCRLDPFAEPTCTWLPRGVAGPDRPSAPRPWSAARRSGAGCRDVVGDHPADRRWPVGARPRLGDRPGGRARASPGRPAGAVGGGEPSAGWPAGRCSRRPAILPRALTGDALVRRSGRARGAPSTPVGRRRPVGRDPRSARTAPPQAPGRAASPAAARVPHQGRRPCRFDPGPRAGRPSPSRRPVGCGPSPSRRPVNCGGAGTSARRAAGPAARRPAQQRPNRWLPTSDCPKRC